MEIRKVENGFEISMFGRDGNIINKVFDVNISLEDAYSKMIEIEDKKQEEKKLLEETLKQNERLKIEKQEEKNKIKKIEEENKQLTHKKNEILEKWASDKSDDELIKNKDLFPRLYDGIEIHLNHRYNYAGVLYKAKKSFKYDNQHSPALEPTLWQKVGEEKKSDYDLKFTKAKIWNRDEAFEAETYVTWYGDLYKSSETISDNAEPGRDDRWVKIEREIKKEE
ncbi:hypothetical protein ABGF48_00780 [Helcococcus bovis]|uniref:hypothetical protein n=1 Tax=Helcococcus bovis TaxID=3153252 RepID=UPI0038B9B341